MKMRHPYMGLMWLALLTAVAMGSVILFAHLSGRHAMRVEERLQLRAREDSAAQALLEVEAEKARRRARFDSISRVRAANKEAYLRQRMEWDREKAERQARREAEKNIPIELHPFNPNIADSTELVHLGFLPWMARGVERYRAAGGSFRKVEDVRRIYGMTDSLYQVLLPYIVLPPVEKVVKQRKVDTVLSINTADTTELMLLRGVGSFTARQIVRYRDQIGGFYSLEQLREVPYIHNVDSLILHFSVDSTQIRKLFINRSSVRQLTRHRYLSFEQAEAIDTYRHRKGAFRSEVDLRRSGAFTEDQLLHILPYIDFSE